MAKVHVQSSSVAEISYDPKTKILEVVFRKGDVYQYLDVPMNVYHDMICADSVGRFFNLQVKSNYKFTKVKDSSRDQQ